MEFILRHLAAWLLWLVFHLPPLRHYAAWRMFRTVPHSRRLGFRVMQVRRGKVTACVEYRDELIGNPATGYLHAGVLTSLIDQTSGAAAFFSLAPPDYVATVDLRIDHLRAAPPGRALIATAECYHVTSQILFVRCVAHDGDPADPVAFSVSCFMRTGSMVDQMPFRHILPRRKRSQKSG